MYYNAPVIIFFGAYSMGFQGKALIPQEKETIVTLKEYFDRTRDDPQEQAISNVQRVANALGIGIATVNPHSTFFLLIFLYIN